MLTENLEYLWAKARQGDGLEQSSMDEMSPAWHPLVLHLVDVAAVADVILEREPQSTRDRMGEVVGLSWMNARPWLLLIIACHDLGKACPGFQYKRKDLAVNIKLKWPKLPNLKMNHAFVSQIELSRILLTKGWSPNLSELLADAVGCHHGNRATPSTLERLEWDANAVGNGEWTLARNQLYNALSEVFQQHDVPKKSMLSGPDYMLLAGLTSFADWIGSNEAWFDYGTPNDCADLRHWFNKRKLNAGLALDEMGWDVRDALMKEKRNFSEVFGFEPRPLQSSMQALVGSLEAPAIILVEAPMGEGKTEAAFYAHLELQRRFGHRGMYIALPTKATGNAMFQRTLAFLTNQGFRRALDLQLIHGATQLNEQFQSLRLTGIHDENTGGEVRAGEWFTHKKRALLSEYGVGTVDQALMPILPVRHHFVRLWGLANRVVVFDEIHAYDAYTGTLLIHLLHWLQSLGSSVILLSATLPPAIRRKIANINNNDLPAEEANYPRLTVFRTTGVDQIHVESDPARNITITIRGIDTDDATIESTLLEHLEKGGLGLALINTVQRAQGLYMRFPTGSPIFYKDHHIGKTLEDGTEVYLFHARYPALQRQIIEDHALATFGIHGVRSGRKILIGTQVVEQSLDLDFDVIVTDLAPVDLILQRAGRLWRHKRENRAVTHPVLYIAGLVGDEPPDFDKPLYWSAVYREDVLLYTWQALIEKTAITLPDDIDSLVTAVYEEEVELPDKLLERLNKAIIAGDGKSISQQNQAHQAIIGFPDDASWNDPTRFILYDEDEPGVHRTLLAATRLGEESIAVIPIRKHDDAATNGFLSRDEEKMLLMRTLSVSRKGVVGKLKAIGVPIAWKQSSLLRNSIPLYLEENGAWVEDESVRLDNELGLTYQIKEGK